jgi:hypothetical protein
MPANITAWRLILALLPFYVVPAAADPCSLLKPAEIQTVAGSAKVGPGVPSTLPGVAMVNCRFTWGAGNTETNLDVGIGDASKMYPGVSAADLKTGMLLAVKTGGPNASVIAGVGEAAKFESSYVTHAETTAYVKGSLLIVNLLGPDARARKDQVIALLKAATGRM